MASGRVGCVGQRKFESNPRVYRDTMTQRYIQVTAATARSDWAGYSVFEEAFTLGHRAAAV